LILVEDIWLILGTWAAVGVAIWAVIMSNKANQKTLKMQGLNLVFEKLNDEKKRRARAEVLRSYYNYLIHNDKPIVYTIENFKDHPVIDITKFDTSISSYVEIVKADFEVIAVMVHNGLVDKQAYLDAYWGSMLRCYMALHGNIIAAREQSGTEHYTTYFQEQSENDGFEFWREKHPKSKIIYHSD